MSTRTMINLLRTANRLSEPEKEQLAEYARVIEARRTGLYETSASEKKAIGEALEQSRLNLSVSDRVLQEADNRFGV